MALANNVIDSDETICRIGCHDWLTSSAASMLISSSKTCWAISILLVATAAIKLICPIWGRILSCVNSNGTSCYVGWLTYIRYCWCAFPLRYCWWVGPFILEESDHLDVTPSTCIKQWASKNLEERKIEKKTEKVTKHPTSSQYNPYQSYLDYPNCCFVAGSFIEEDSNHLGIIVLSSKY